MHQVALETKFCMLALNIQWSSVCNLLHVAAYSLEFLGNFRFLEYLCTPVIAVCLVLSEP